MKETYIKTAKEIIEMNKTEYRFRCGGFICEEDESPVTTFVCGNCTDEILRLQGCSLPKYCSKCGYEVIKPTKEDGRHVTEFSSGYKVYATRQCILDEKEYEAKFARIKSLFTLFNHPELTIEVLREIHKILEDKSEATS